MHRKHLTYKDPKIKKIHCNLCGKSFGTSSSTIVRHVKGKKHEKRFKEDAQKLKNVGQWIGENEEAKKEEAEHRERVVSALLERGVPLNKCQGSMKELMEEKRERKLNIGHHSDLARSTLPALTKQEDLTDQELLNQCNMLMSLMFDGYSKKEEYSCVIARMVSTDFNIIERVVCVRMFSSSLSGAQWGQLVLKVREKLGAKLVFTIADGHPSNGVVGTTLAGVTDNFFHSFCLVHSLVIVPAKFDCSLVNHLLGLWSKVFKNSMAARKIFKKHALEEWKRKHKIRWHSTHAVLDQIIRKWMVLLPIAEEIESEGYCELSIGPLKEYLKKFGAATSDVAIQCCAVYDASDFFVKTVYFLEGSSFMAPFVWNRLEQLRLFVDSVSKCAQPSTRLPNVCAILKQSALPSQKWGAVKKVIAPGFKYFNDHFVNQEKDSKARDFKNALALFKFAAIFHPKQAKEMISKKEFNLDEFMANGFVKAILCNLGPGFLGELKADFGCFVERLEKTVTSESKFTPDELVTWWSTHGGICRSWAAAARLFALLQPSEASVERAFAMMRAAVGDLQEHMMEDMVELRLRKQYKRKEAIEPAPN
jgi:hypothetical protein